MALNTTIYTVNPLNSKTIGDTYSVTQNNSTNPFSLNRTIFSCPANEVYKIKKMIVSATAYSTDAFVADPLIITIGTGVFNNNITSFSGTGPYYKFYDLELSGQWVTPTNIISLSMSIDPLNNFTDSTLSFSCSIVLDAYFN